VIICAANLFTVAIRKLEEQSILLVHTNTMKAGEISPEFFQSVGGRNAQVLERRAGVHQVEFLLYSAPKFAG